MCALHSVRVLSVSCSAPIFALLFHVLLRLLIASYSTHTPFHTSFTLSSPSFASLLRLPPSPPSFAPLLLLPPSPFPSSPPPSQTRAITRVQALFRLLLVNWRPFRYPIVGDANQIQRIFRGHQGRRERQRRITNAADIAEKERVASIRIQRIARGRPPRQGLKALYQLREQTVEREREIQEVRRRDEREAELQR